MPTALQLRRGTTSQHSSFTGANGEVTVDTTKKTAVVHDGSTAGGIPLATEAQVTARVRTDTNAQGLNATQQLNARTNIAAAASADVLALTGGTLTGDLLINSTGRLRIPVGTTGQRPGTPIKGDFRFNDTSSSFEGYNGTAWGSIGGGSGGAAGTGGNAVFYENDQQVTNSYTITTNKNALSAGPVTINNGVTVTIPLGSVWTIV
jgi:hypothetical protein